MIELQAETSGPLFDGRAVRAVDGFLNEAEERVADQGVNRVQQRLNVVLRNPTGFYESRVVSERAREDWAVTDSGVVHGPWLEGESSRNQTTRFKGYRTFRTISQELQADAATIAEQQVLPTYVARMNG